MSYARPVRNTSTGRASSLLGTIPARTAMTPFDVLPLALAHGTAHPASRGSFPQQSLSFLHGKRMAPTVLQGCKMYTPEDALDRLHPRLMALIEHQKSVCGCTMKAVKQVAKRVGASEFWVRRITGRYGKVKIQAHQFFNVVKEHVRVSRAKAKAARATRILSREKTSKAELSA